MFSQLQIVHRKKPLLFSDTPESWRVFVTCLRSLAISFDGHETPNAQSTDQVYQHDKAYRFLLEVACGLQSPILGETEVFGQFRDFADGWTEQSAFFQNIYADVKNVRQTHLSHLGSQSYGSWVRKQVSSDRPVHIVGTGQLAQEVFIWLRKQNANIQFYSRDPERASARLTKSVGYPVAVRDFSAGENFKKSVVVVAAPVSAQLVQNWMGKQRPHLLIDLREESNTNRISHVHFSLQDVFSEIEKGRHNASQKISQARQMIEDIVTKRFKSQTIRPFGWDDLCA
jgi:glutamyl-tRNA reductase